MQRLRESGWGVQACTDRGSSHIHLMQHCFDPLECVDLIVQAPREGLEFLPQCHWHGILELGATHLHDVIEFLRFGPEGVGQIPQFAESAYDFRGPERCAVRTGRRRWWTAQPFT